MKNTILFDLDGTLLDTLTDLTASVNYALSRVGLPARSRDEVRSFLGDGYKVLMEKACGGADSADALKYFTEYYAVHLEDNTAPYPGVTDALAALAAKGRKIAAGSSRRTSRCITAFRTRSEKSPRPTCCLPPCATCIRMRKTA